jgi:hypothetical protein
MRVSFEDSWLTKSIFVTMDAKKASQLVTFTLIQWKPLNVITLGQRETDNINRMITISELTTYERVIWGRKNSFNLITLTE